MEVYEYENGIMIPDTYYPVKFMVVGEDKIRSGYLDSSSEFVDEKENRPFYPHQIKAWWNDVYAYFNKEFYGETVKSFMKGILDVCKAVHPGGVNYEDWVRYVRTNNWLKMHGYPKRRRTR